MTATPSKASASESNSLSRSQQKPSKTSVSSDASRSWARPRVRIFASVLIIGHLLAVVTAPLSFQTRSRRGSSPSVELIGAPVAGYGEFLYLNRGYAFFAPDPGPSHLFQAAILPAKPDAESNVSGITEPVFPDRNVHWPRLLYHRHFMLAEFLTEVYQQPGPPAELIDAAPEAATEWARLRARYENIRRSLTTHLQSLHPNSTVAIRRLEHLIPDFMEHGASELTLNDPSYYQVLLDRPPSIAPSDSNGPADAAAMPLPGKTVATEVIPQSIGKANIDKKTNVRDDRAANVDGDRSP